MSGGPFSPTTTKSDANSTQTTTLNTTNRNISGVAGPVASEGSTLDYSSVVNALENVGNTTNTIDARREVSGSGFNTAVGDSSSLNLSYAPVTISTDQGAIDSGAYVANTGIHAATMIAAQAVDASGRANDVIRGLATDAVNANSSLALAALDDSNGTTAHALNIVDATTQLSAANEKSYAEGITNFAGGVLTQFGNTLSQYQLAEQNQLGNVVSALNASFVDNTKSSDQRVTDATLEAGAQSADLIKTVAKYAITAAVVALIGYVILRGSK